MPSIKSSLSGNQRRQGLILFLVPLIVLAGWFMATPKPADAGFWSCNYRDNVKRFSYNAMKGAGQIWGATGTKGKNRSQINKRYYAVGGVRMDETIKWPVVTSKFPFVKFEKRRINFRVPFYTYVFNRTYVRTEVKQARNGKFLQWYFGYNQRTVGGGQAISERFADLIEAIETGKRLGNIPALGRKAVATLLKASRGLIVGELTAIVGDIYAPLEFKTWTNRSTGRKGGGVDGMSNSAKSSWYCS
jgi:hypothetical protein